MIIKQINRHINAYCEDITMNYLIILHNPTIQFPRHKNSIEKQRIWIQHAKKFLYDEIKIPHLNSVGNSILKYQNIWGANVTMRRLNTCNNNALNPDHMTGGGTPLFTICWWRPIVGSAHQVEAPWKGNSSNYTRPALGLSR